jgi:hypothetical protein
MLQMISHGDPLAQLSDFVPFQNVHEFRLSRQDDLYQLLPICLQVRNQPNLLEHRCFEILCLIDDEDDGAALGILLEKKQVERIEGGRAVGHRRWNAEFSVDGLKKLRWRKGGIEDQGRTMMIGIKLAEECTQDRCFP